MPSLCVYILGALTPTQKAHYRLNHRSSPMGKGFLKYDSQNPPKMKIGRLIFINVFYCLTDIGFF